MSADSHPSRKADAFAQALLSLMIGAVMGVLGAQATFAGKIASIDTRLANVERQVTSLDAKVDAMRIAPRGRP